MLPQGSLLLSPAPPSILRWWGWCCFSLRVRRSLGDGCHVIRHHGIRHELLHLPVRWGPPLATAWGALPFLSQDKAQLPGVRAASGEFIALLFGRQRQPALLGALALAGTERDDAPDSLLVPHALNEVDVGG